MKRPPWWIDFAVTLVFTTLLLAPELREPRVWWYMAMRVSREGARRCGQVALLAETRYRTEVAR